MKKKKTSQVNRSIQLVLFIGLCVITWLIGMFFCNTVTNGIATIIMMGHQHDTYCTENDPVYQAITTQGDSWTEFFTPYELQGSTPYIELNIPYSRRRIALARYAMPSGALEIYVQVDAGWPGTPLGLRGYLFIPSGASPSSDWDWQYTTTPISGNIYCYEKVK